MINGLFSNVLDNFPLFTHFLIIFPSLSLAFGLSPCEHLTDVHFCIFAGDCFTAQDIYGLLGEMFCGHIKGDVVTDAGWYALSMSI